MYNAYKKVRINCYSAACRILLHGANVSTPLAIVGIVGVDYFAAEKSQV
jgi:hypothetical protein